MKSSNFKRSAWLTLTLALSLPTGIFAQELPQAPDQIITEDGETIALCVQGYTADGHEVFVCFDPNTTDDYIQQVMAQFATRYVNGDVFSPQFWIVGRWSSTSHGSTGSLGNPITLQWSFVPDGVNIPDEGTNNLTAAFNSQFGGNTALWQSKFAQCFTRWSQLTGITYIQVSDDGASLFGSPGAIGPPTRGDCRISGNNIDGSGGVLAYNYFPNTGDMVIDTADNWANSTNDYRFLRNVVMHEHGHGMGLGHTVPCNGTKLMEPFINTNFDGPQDDDIRGAQRNYGDKFENNDQATAATPVTIPGFSPVNVGDVSLDSTSDADWYSFTAGANNSVNITVTPVGSTYTVGNQSSGCSGTTSSTNTLSIQNLDVQLRSADGLTILATANTNGIGLAETISGFALPSAGTYTIRVFSGTGSTNSTQRYTLTIDLDTPGELNVTPLTDFATSGQYSGTFTPSSTVYNLANPGGAAINWTASADVNWVTVSPSSGSIDAGSSVNVTVSTNTNTSALTPNVYNGVLTITNTTNGTGNTTRNLVVTVNKAATKNKAFDATGSPDTNVTLKAKLTRKTDNAPLPGYEIIFKVDGDEVGRGTTNSNGVAKFRYRIPADKPLGTYNLRVEFVGDSLYEPDNGSATLTVQ